VALNPGAAQSSTNMPSKKVIQHILQCAFQGLYQARKAQALPSRYLQPHHSRHSLLGIDVLSEDTKDVSAIVLSALLGGRDACLDLARGDLLAGTCQLCGGIRSVVFSCVLMFAFVIQEKIFLLSFALPVRKIWTSV
jgi:hypothetical protein